MNSLVSGTHLNVKPKRKKNLKSDMIYLFFVFNVLLKSSRKNQNSIFVFTAFSFKKG